MNKEVKQKITALNEKIQKEWSKKRLKYVVEKESMTYLDLFMKHVQILDVHFSHDLESDDFEEAHLERYVLKLSWNEKEIDYGKIELKQSYDIYGFSEWLVDVNHCGLCEADGYPLSEENFSHEEAEEGVFYLTEKDEEIFRQFLDEKDLDIKGVIQTIVESKQKNVLETIIKDNPQVPLFINHGTLYIQLNNGIKLKVEREFGEFES